MKVWLPKLVTGQSQCDDAAAVAAAAVAVSRCLSVVVGVVVDAVTRTSLGHSQRQLTKAALCRPRTDDNFL